MPTFSIQPRRQSRAGVACTLVLAAIVLCMTIGSRAAQAASAANDLMGIACPSVSQCTTVSLQGTEMTFNPTSPGKPTPQTIDGGRALSDVACPSISRCTAVDGSPRSSKPGGYEITFNPLSPGTPTPVKIDNSSDGQLWSMACPSESQCTTVGYSGVGVTFDPASQGTITATEPEATTPENVPLLLVGVACPSGTQCTEVDSSGAEMTFNPVSPSIHSLTQIDRYGDRYGSPLGIACPSMAQCTAVDTSGKAITFNPETATPAKVDTVKCKAISRFSCYFFSVACPSTSQCTGVSFDGQEMTFNPLSPGTFTPTTIDKGHNLNAVACPSVSQCTAVSQAGQIVTFNPMRRGGRAGKAKVRLAA